MKWLQQLNERCAFGTILNNKTKATKMAQFKGDAHMIKTFYLNTLLRLRVFFAATKSLLNPWAGEITPVGRTSIRVIRASGEVENLGLVSTKVVTTAGVGYIVDAFQNTTELENMKYHASGTGTTAEATGDTALVTEVATRATGTTTEGASANIYRTVGTISYTSSLAITEHGVFSASSAGVLLDRSVFSAINVVNGDSIEFTYELTLPAGS